MTKTLAVVTCPNADHDPADQHSCADCGHLLDHGFTSKHRYFYYCGDQVTAKPEYLGYGPARLKYIHRDGVQIHAEHVPAEEKLCPAPHSRVGVRICPHIWRISGDVPGKRGGILHPRSEKSVSSNCQLRDYRNPSSRRRHRDLEKPMPVAGDAMEAARLDPTGPCTADESLKRNVH